MSSVAAPTLFGRWRLNQSWVFLSRTGHTCQLQSLFSPFSTQFIWLLLPSPHIPFSSPETHLIPKESFHQQTSKWVCKEVRHLPGFFGPPGPLTQLSANSYYNVWNDWSS